ncbi:MAG: arginine--tRNA ligase, partial [Patescibacteria group bacterium]
MQILPHELKVLFVEAALQAFPTLEQEELLKLTTLEDPKNEAHGDYACPLPFRLAKKLGLAPQKIGEKILEHFPKDFRVEEVTFAAPGYLNLRLKIRYLEELLKELETGFHIKKEEETRHKPVIVEYSSTNAAKPMGVHHIITTILGDAIANLYEFMGWEIVRINHLGDWGTQFGKLIYAVETWGDKVDIERHPNQEFMRLYVKFNEEA